MRGDAHKTIFGVEFWGVAAAGCLLGATLTWAAPTRAQDSEYQTTIEQALAEFDRGSYREALAMFRRAHELRPSARTLRGLGMASYELRAYVDAVGYFGEALASTENPLTDEQRTELTALLERARTYVGRFRVEPDPADAVVRVDGNDVGHTVVLDIGPHTVAASAPGREPLTREITVAGGENTTLELTLLASGPGGFDALVPALLLAAGGAVAIGGIVMIGAGVADRGAVEGAPVGTDWRTVAGSYDRAEPLSIAGTVFLLVGAAAVGTATIWLVLGSASGGETRVTLSPGGLRIAGTF